MKHHFLLSLLVLFCSCNVKELSDTIANSTNTTWENYFVCHNFGSESYAETITFREKTKTYTMTTDYYAVPNCLTNYEFQRDVIDFTYEYNVATQELRSTIFRGQVAYLNAQEIIDRNASMECGYQNWQLKVLHDVTDVMCTGGTISSLLGPHTYTGVVKTSTSLVLNTLVYSRI
jgi:hypothetical protein